MIVFFVGTPGSGKTYEAVKKIIDNLRIGRVVCTNIDGMDEPKQQEYMKNLLGMDDFTFHQNFRFLSKEQTVKFWKTEKKEKILPLSGEIVQEDELICPKGSLIVIDEVHKHFNSRDWQNKENREMADWASTHRHEGYDLVLITQDIEKVEKQVRSLTEWSYFFRKVNFLGSKVSKKYLCYSYSGDDHHGTPLSKNVRTYQAKYFLCYKSYTNADAKEVGFMSHVNILKHPIFFAIPVVLIFCVWMASKSSLASGDLFGTNKRLKESAQKIEQQRKTQQNLTTPLPAAAIQKPVSSATTPQPITAAPLQPPAQELPPGWYTYPVSAYIRNGLQVLYMVHGVILRPHQCRNFNPTFKTIECYGPHINPPPPAALQPSTAVASDSTQDDKSKPYEPMGKYVLNKSIHLSDDKERVDFDNDKRN